jgi:hypothetical protein
MMEKMPTSEEKLSSSIHETDSTVSYLGVTLEKAENTESSLIPKKEKYESYLNDEFSLELQKDIAVCFHAGDPMLMEGGTSLGKTTTVKKMCADLGYEVHYVNLNGATDAEDLMGRYIPNANKKTVDDPEFVFIDGKVTSGLRQEEGKIKVVILDEFNATPPNILIRLHEVVDALERNDTVVLSEDASEVIPTSKEKTKIIALTNPPGGGYIGRSPLDPAQLRRWVYLKLPDQLPAKSFSNYVKFLSGVETDTVLLPEENFLLSSDKGLTMEELKNIEGISEILVKYEEFHRSAQALLKSRDIAADQPQKFTFDDRMEPARVMNFVRRFYNENVTETFQDAIRYYYINKLASTEDKEKLEETLRFVQYRKKVNQSRRNPLDDQEKSTYESELNEIEMRQAKSKVESGEAVLIKFAPGRNPSTMDMQWEANTVEDGVDIKYVIDRRVPGIKIPDPAKEYICTPGRDLVNNMNRIVRTVLINGTKPDNWDQIESAENKSYPEMLQELKDKYANN